VAAGLGAAASGCGSGEDRLVPVEGVVTLDGKPLTVGGVAFKPDATKGNKTQHQPVGELDENGRYTLTTTNRPGAPPGWYKVLVFSSEQMKDSLRGGAPTDPKWVTDRKYTAEATTPLSVEVVEGAKDRAYDLKVTK